MAAVLPACNKECALCTNDFKTPKILPCGHLLCRECVIFWMDYKSDAGCPLCTCPIVEHQGNSSQSSADVADVLPTDFVMEAIVESARMLVKDHICTVCDDGRAEYICMQCLEKMCKSCTKIHKKMVATRSHNVKSLSTVTLERLAANHPALCADHCNQMAELFCVGHNLVICTSCFSNKHSTCPDVMSLDEKMKSAENALRSLKKVLVKAEDNLEQSIGNLLVRIQTADATKQENMLLVDKTCDSIQKMVEECRNELKGIINDSISKFNNSLYDINSKLEQRLGKVTSHKHLVTRAKTVRPRPALIPAAQTLTDRVHNLNLNARLEGDARVNPSPNIAKCCDDVVKQIKSELQSLEQQQTASVSHFNENFETDFQLTNCRTTAQKVPITAKDVVVSRDAMVANVLDEAPVLVFHENCGRNILLMKGRTTARNTQRLPFGHSAVLSRDAMAVNVLYEVKIDETDGYNYIKIGVTGIPPAKLTLKTSIDDLEEFIIISYSGVRRNGYLLQSNIGRALRRMNSGSRVGVLVDSSNDLHLYVDGHDQGVAAKDVALPCFAVFDIYVNVLQVTARPTSRRTCSI